jgi:hypothetical protein
MKDIKWIDINGAQVVDITPDHHRELALVDLEVLNKLTKLLPLADLYEIKKGFKNEISSARSIEHLVKVCENFTAFHKTVNLIQEVDAYLHTISGEADAEPKGKISLDC